MTVNYDDDDNDNDDDDDDNDDDDDDDDDVGRRSAACETRSDASKTKWRSVNSGLLTDLL